MKDRKLLGYMIFSHDDYSAEGGWGDFVKTIKTLDELKFEPRRGDTRETIAVYDDLTFEIIEE